MYLVKLDLSVSGLPASATRGCVRHCVKPFIVDSPFDAIDRALHGGDSLLACIIQNLYDAVFCAVHDNVPATRDVVMSARYTVIDSSDDECKATYTRYYKFDYECD